LRAGAFAHASLGCGSAVKLSSPLPLPPLPPHLQQLLEPVSHLERLQVACQLALSTQALI